MTWVRGQTGCDLESRTGPRSNGSVWGLRWIKFEGWRGTGTLPTVILNCSSHNGERLTVLGKLIPQPGTHCNRYRENDFYFYFYLFILPLPCRVTRMRPLGQPTHFKAWTGSWENWQKLTKGDNSHQSQIWQISICGTWWRHKGKISSCPFLSKFWFAGKKH